MSAAGELIAAGELVIVWLGVSAEIGELTKSRSSVMPGVVTSGVTGSVRAAQGGAWRIAWWWT
jgi:hypothetical protein